LNTTAHIYACVVDTLRLDIRCTFFQIL